MKALLINVHSNRNAGDAALTTQAVRQLRAHFPGLELTLAMDDPASYTGEARTAPSLFTWLKSAGPGGEARWRAGRLLLLLPATLLPLLLYRLSGRFLPRLAPRPLRALLEAYLQAELVLSAPGGFLYSSGRGVALLLSLYSMALALAAGRPLYLFPQSYGPFHAAWERRAVGWVLRRARLVMVREAVSLEELRACGLPPERLHLVPDIALAFEPDPPQAARAWLQGLGFDLDQDRPLLGVTMINWGAQNTRFHLQERYEAAVCAAVRFFVETYGGRALLLPQVTGPYPAQDDRAPARRILPRLADLQPSVTLVEEALPPALLKAVYGQMDLFIGTRMHSNIFALGMGVPVIAIGYQHKTRGIARMLGVEAWALDIQETGAQALIDRLTALWEGREALRAGLRASIPALAAQADRAGALIAGDFRRLRQDPKNLS